MVVLTRCKTEKAEIGSVAGCMDFPCVELFLRAQR